MPPCHCALQTDVCRNVGGSPTGASGLPLYSFWAPLLTLGPGLASPVERQNAALGDAVYWELFGGVPDTPTSLLPSAGPRASPLVQRAQKGWLQGQGPARRSQPSAPGTTLTPFSTLWAVGSGIFLGHKDTCPPPVLPAAEQNASNPSHLREGM